MKKIIDFSLHSLVFLFLILHVYSPVYAGVPIRISPGTSSQMVQGILVGLFDGSVMEEGVAWKDYLLKVKRGQTLSVRIRNPSTQNKVYLSLWLPGDSLYSKPKNQIGSDESEFNNFYQEIVLVVPATGDYKIRVIGEAKEEKGKKKIPIPYAFEVAVTE